MKVVIVPLENIVTIDGVTHWVNCGRVDKAIHVVNWDGSFGEIEWVNNSLNPADFKPNSLFVELDPLYQSLINDWSHEDAHKSSATLNFGLSQGVKNEIARVNSLRADSDRNELLAAVKNATPEEIKAYVNNRITDLASARDYLAKLTLLVMSVVRN